MPSLILAALLLAGCVDDPPPEVPARYKRLFERSGVSLKPIGRFNSPVWVTSEPGGDPDRLFVVERSGRVLILHEGRKRRRPFLDIRKRVLDNHEQGLLSMVFAPDYRRSGKLYVYFVDRLGDIRVQEFRRSKKDPDHVKRGSRRNVLRIEHRTFPRHYGGAMAFGPDGKLYISTGDGGGVGNPLRTAQSRRSLLGKILRIDPRRARRGRPYAVPRGNPFARTRNARRAIWAYGLRNPWRFSFDRANGNMVIADVGQESLEEVNFLPRSKRGANFGWNVFEGTRRFRKGHAKGHVRPVITLSHKTGHCSVIGGYVVRDRALKGLYGRYVYADFCKGSIRHAKLTSRRAIGDRRLRVRKLPGISSFGEDSRGRIYAVTLAGRIYRFEPK